LTQGRKSHNNQIAVKG